MPGFAKRRKLSFALPKMLNTLLHQPTLGAQDLFLLENTENFLSSLNMSSAFLANNA
jgi:hypothetical protein